MITSQGLSIFWIRNMNRIRFETMTPYLIALIIAAVLLAEENLRWLATRPARDDYRNSAAWHNLKRIISLPTWSLACWSHSISSEPDLPGRIHVTGAEVTSDGNTWSISNANEPKPEGSVAALIPAYRPTQALVETVRGLQFDRWSRIFVVDDGSGPDYHGIFAEVSACRNVTVATHAINMGKGAALKTGINLILCQVPDVAGIITVDADGQHAPSDVRKVCERFQRDPSALVLGARAFDGKVPFRSRIGNQLTRHVMRIVLGSNLSDTQTGLRAIPRSMLPQLLKVKARGYEFELETLIAAKYSSIPIREQPIKTIYEHGNPSSHFQPLRDSMRIYFVLLCFLLISISTAVLDNLVFFFALHFTGSVLTSQLLARTASVLYAYPLARRAVFLSEERHQILLPRYILLVAVNTAFSYAGIETLIAILRIDILPAKLSVEALLFVVNFLIQRDWIFTRGGDRTVSARSTGG